MKPHVFHSASPVIDPNLLGTDVDRLIMREAILAARRFVSAPAFAGYILAEAVQFPDTLIDEYLRNTTTNVYHPVGTAAMSPRDAEWGVVDPDLKVKGLLGLRVIDASILVRTVSDHIPFELTYYW